MNVGDIVLIEEGNKVPTNLLLIETNDLKIDESSLTGESLGVSKSTDYDESVSLDLDKNEKKLVSNIIYMESNVIKENRVGVVFAVE